MYLELNKRVLKGLVWYVENKFGVPTKGEEESNAVSKEEKFVFFVICKKLRCFWFVEFESITEVENWFCVFKKEKGSLTPLEELDSLIGVNAVSMNWLNDGGSKGDTSSL